MIKIVFEKNYFTVKMSLFELRALKALQNSLPKYQCIKFF